MNTQSTSASGAAGVPNDVMPSRPGGSTAAKWEQHAFAIGDAEFQWLDVVLAAMAHGDWPRFERQLAEGLACEARVAAEHVFVPEAAIDEAAIAFRYERDLISASDMTAWLARVGIASEQWMAHITRRVLRRMWAHELEMLLDRYAPSPRHLETAAVAEGVASGVFDTFDVSFSERAAVAFEACPDVFATAPVATHADTDVATRLVRQHTDWLTMWPEAECIARLLRILRIDHAYRTASERLSGSEALAGAIDSHRLDWIVIDQETIGFADEGAAREAILCVREDGMSMQDVAEISRHRVTRDSRFLDALPTEYRDRLLSAVPGSVIGPLELDGRYEVAVVLARTAPTLEDERIADRARAVLLAHAGRRAAREHVKRRPPV